MRRASEIRANPNIEFSQASIDRFYATLVKILEEKYNVTIEYTVREKTPEEKAAFPDKWAEVIK